MIVQGILFLISMETDIFYRMNQSLIEYIEEIELRNQARDIETGQ